MADAKTMVGKIEAFVVERLLRWAWKPITANGVGGLRPSCALTLDVTSAQASSDLFSSYNARSRPILLIHFRWVADKRIIRRQGAHAALRLAARLQVAGRPVRPPPFVYCSPGPLGLRLCPALAAAAAAAVCKRCGRNGSL